MATYAVGDIQGCQDELLQLLESMQFDPQVDQLWFAGDLVNRGPKSLETLRFVKGLGDAAKVVLGNHDMHLLAVLSGNLRHYLPGSLDDILNAPDRTELSEWLRHRPFLHHDPQLNWSMVHAGLPPQWTLAEAIKQARHLERHIQGVGYQAFFADMYGNKPNLWDEELRGMDRLRFATNCFTRLRYCNQHGKLKLKAKCAPADADAELIPWFQVPGRKTEQDRILFGHWSTLGFVQHNNSVCLDSGCLWGGHLTAIRLDEPITRFSLPCPVYQAPGVGE